MSEGQDWDSIPVELVEDCAQLTKANSIEGNKRDNVIIIYTPWSNLKKDGSMAVGQVGFHDPKKTKRVHLTTRTNAIINRLQKTRTEIPPPASTSHLRESRDANLAAKRKVANEVLRKKKKEEDRLATERRENKAKSEAEWNALYGDGRVQDEGRSNNDGGWDEDDFM
ncbi:MAG: hypothetical protein MMC23_000540 [Stictis urceolatum]|nr:hypothetical protein [Stictis urceolata]